MITRGHYIGEVIDEFSTISQQVAMRNRLGFTDLTVFAENFFRDVLNAIQGGSLKNLNENRSNEPGLDLGDAEAKLGVQVTSTASAAKVRHTLTKITSEQRLKFAKIVILVVGKRQGSYTLVDDIFRDFSFADENVWDVNTLARMAVGLQIDALQKLHGIVRAESARLKVELEVPSEDGKYPTSGFDKWEHVPKPKIGDGEAFISYWEAQIGDPIGAAGKEDTRNKLADLGNRLSRLPRITREFLVMLYERREPEKATRFKDPMWSRLVLNKAARLYRGEDFRGELDILAHEQFVMIDGDDPGDCGPPEIGIRLPIGDSHLRDGFLDFVLSKNLDLRKVLGDVDLSAF